jgi:hypothetical protein
MAFAGSLLSWWGLRIFSCSVPEAAIVARRVQAQLWAPVVSAEELTMPAGACDAHPVRFCL